MSLCVILFMILFYVAGNVVLKEKSYYFSQFAIRDEFNNFIAI